MVHSLLESKSIFLQFLYLLILTVGTLIFNFLFIFQSNASGDPCQFDPEIVSRQIKALQIFETVHLLRSGRICHRLVVWSIDSAHTLHDLYLLFHLYAGYTHRMRLIPFAQRYFVHDDQLSQADALEIAQSYQKLLSENKRENPGKILYVGRKHVFLR